MVFARVAEYFSGTDPDQQLAANNGQHDRGLEHGLRRRQEEIMDMDDEVDLDAVRHPYEHVRRTPSRAL